MEENGREDIWSISKTRREIKAITGNGALACFMGAVCTELEKQEIDST